jgi:site-specific DNA-methyltransferase (adenine-specific)
MRKFILGDCMDLETGIPSYPDDHFDLSVVDPPYFSGPEKRVCYGSRQSNIGVSRYKASKRWTMVDLDYFNELVRVSRYYIFWGCNYYNFDFHTGRLVWDKCNDSSDYSDCEIAATNLWDHTRIVRYMWNGMLQGSLSDGTKMQGNKSLNEKRIHPTQKPVQLYRKIIDKARTYLPLDPKVLSTHVGSGSDLIAYTQEGFQCIGYEIDETRYNDATKRMNEVLAQKSLFEQ